MVETVKIGEPFVDMIQLIHNIADRPTLVILISQQVHQYLSGFHIDVMSNIFNTNTRVTEGRPCTNSTFENTNLQMLSNRTRMRIRV